jgi:predicted choloylglycine hydrolase
MQYHVTQGGKRTMKKGKILEKEEGLTILRLEGSPYEMGYQHGEIFREEINLFSSNAKKIVCQHEGNIVGQITFPIICQLAKKLGRLIPEQFQQEIKGIADGAKVDYNFLLLENLIEELSAIYHWYLRPLLPSFLKCSCFVVKDTDGIIWGRNLDYPFFTETLPSLSVLYIYLPDQGFPFISLGWPGNIGAVTGISRNLSLVLLSSPTKSRAFKGIPEEILSRQIIQYSQDLEDALEKIIPGLVILGQNLVLISKNEARVVELSILKKAIRSLQTQGCLTVTNHFQVEEIEEEQAVFFPKPKKTSIPDEFFTLEGSKKREEKLRRLCLSQAVEPKRAMEILDQVATPGTVQSVVALPQKEEFWVAKRTQPPVTKGEWMHFRIDDLL